jgi:positive regulator of sigma E activity
MTLGTISNTIEHLGVIREINPSTIKISLLNVAGCATCHTKATCSVADVDNKVIDVVNAGQHIQKGDTVKVVFEKSLGPMALFLGYLLPFFFLMIVLVATWTIANDELTAGLAALFSVAVYYAALTQFRSKLSRKFAFRILKD